MTSKYALYLSLYDLFIIEEPAYAFTISAVRIQRQKKKKS